MITFKDLIIKADDTLMESLINALAKELPTNSLWSRKEDKENNVLGIEKVYTFQRLKDSKLPSAGLSFFPKDNNSWYVPNVVPLECDHLSHQQYNAILSEFYDLFIKSNADELDIDTEIDSGEVNDIDILGIQGAKLLSAFSSLANKSTGSSHPCDHERWLAFIYEVCNSDKNIDIGLLERLLIERGWDDESAIDLVVQFEFGRDLIEYIKEHA